MYIIAQSCVVHTREMVMEKNCTDRHNVNAYEWEMLHYHHTLAILLDSIALRKLFQLLNCFNFSTAIETRSKLILSVTSGSIGRGGTASVIPKPLLAAAYITQILPNSRKGSNKGEMRHQFCVLLLSCLAV